MNADERGFTWSLSFRAQRGICFDVHHRDTEISLMIPAMDAFGLGPSRVAATDL